MVFFSSASSSRVKTLCAAVMEGSKDVGKDVGHGPMCIKTEKTVDRLRHDGCSRRTRHFLCESGRSAKDMQKPIQRVKFTKAVVRHADIRDQNPSLGMICPGEPHQRNPNAPKFEDRSQEETEWQEQGAREAAWKLAKSLLKLKEKNKATFFSSSENRCLPASKFKPEEREFVVDSGASMHMISKRDLIDAEMDTLTKSCSPTIVITANGEVQTHEEATGVCQRIGYILDYESPRGYASSLIARKALR